MRLMESRRRAVTDGGRPAGSTTARMSKVLAATTVVIGSLAAVGAVIGLARSTGAGAATVHQATLPIGPSSIARTLPLPSNVNPVAAPGAHITSGVSTHLTIVPTFESSVTSSPLASQIESAFNYSVGQFEALYSDPVTVDVNVAYSGSGLGSSSQVSYCSSYAQVAGALKAADTSPDQVTSLQDIPSADPTGSSTWCPSMAEEMVLGLLPANCFSTPTCSSYVPTITFGVQPYTFDPANRAVSGAYDFIGVADHEISEVLGRIPGYLQPSDYTLNDLFRYTAPGSRASPPSRQGPTCRSMRGPRIWCLSIPTVGVTQTIMRQSRQIRSTCL